MTGWIIALQVLASCLIESQAYSEVGHYLVTAPNTARIASPYTITVQVFDTASPVNISAHIEYDDGNFHGNRQFVAVSPAVYRTLTPGSVELLTLQVPYLTTQVSWRLLVRGTGGLQIEQAYSISMDFFEASLFLQADKLSYVAGDTVTLKAFVLHSDLTPFTGPYTVYLQNSLRIRMNEWTATPDAVNTFTFTLDTHTDSGVWSFQAQGARFASQVLGFNVVRLPEVRQTTAGSIEVKVLLPKTMNSSTPLVGSFTASYPMGVAVTGLAEVQLIGNGIRRQTLQFNGGDTFTFPFTDLTVQNSRVVVTVTETATGATGTGEAVVQVYERDVKIEFTEKTPRVFKPHLPFTFYVKITNHADEPLPIPAGSAYGTVYVHGVGHYQKTYDPVKFGPQVHSGSYPILARQVPYPASGVFSVDLDIPDDVTSVDLKVTFQSVQASLQLTRAQHSPSDTYLRLYVEGNVPPVTDTQNADVRFRVLSSQPLSDLTVELVSRNRIVSAVSPTLTNVQTSGQVHEAEFTVTLTWEMTPVTDVIVYQTVWVNRENVYREVISDSVALNVQGLLQNQVSVATASQHAHPGDEVTLSVHARPGSNVGVFVEPVNGASVQKLTPESVTSFVAQNLQRPTSGNAVMSLSATTGVAAFSTANLIWMDGTGLSDTSQAQPIRQIPYHPSATEEKEPFSVYLGTNVTGPDGRTSFTVRLPDKVESWSVTGFAFDAQGHVGFVTQPLTIEAAYDVYADVTGVDHVVSEEHAVLTVLVHNTLTTAAQVMVTLRPIDNVEVVVFSPNGSFHASASANQHTFTISGKSSKQIFFTVTSPAGRYDGVNNAHVELDVVSGASEQTVTYKYTVVSPGVEQTITEADFISVNGHLTKDLSLLPPRRALPGTDTRRVQVTASLTEQLLPIAVREEDVMKEGTGMAAIVHLALPVMLARWRPNLATQLHGPIERAYQRLVSFTANHMGIFRMCTRDAEIYSNWLNIAAMQYVAEANDHIFIDEEVPTATLFDYFTTRYYNGVNDYAHYGEVLFTPPVTGYLTIENNEALKAFTAVVVQDLGNHIDTSGRRWYDQVYDVQRSAYSIVVENLTSFVTEPTKRQDPLTLSYLAVAQLRYGRPDLANNSLNQLLALQDPAGDTRGEMFWTSNPNDTYNRQSGRHVAESRDIVTAANVLQVLVARGLQSEAARVARWLVRQRTADGLFNTAWDTITAFEALLAFDNQPHPEGHAHQDQVQLDTQWSRDSGAASLTATGHGNAWPLVEMKYSLTDDLGTEAYEVVSVVLDETLQHFKLMVCTRWMLADRESGITEQELTFPSGFRVDVSSGIRGQLGVLSIIQRSDNVLTVYFEKIGADSTCYTLSVNRVHAVARSAPGFIVTKSFSHPDFGDIGMYHTRRLEQSSVCDLCTGCCPLPSV